MIRDINIDMFIYFICPFQAGELVFLDLSQRVELCRASLKEKIVNLELLQDIHERTTYLFVSIIFLYQNLGVARPLTIQE